MSASFTHGFSPDLYGGVLSGFGAITTVGTGFGACCWAIAVTLLLIRISAAMTHVVFMSFIDLAPASYSRPCKKFRDQEAKIRKISRDYADSPRHASWTTWLQELDGGER